MRKIQYILAASLSFAALSCMKESVDPVDIPGDAITFSAYRQQVYTRADIGDFEFPVHTQYALFAVESAASEADYLWSTAAGFRHQPEMGEETSSNTIAYGGDEGVSVFKEGKTFDFFAVTYGEQNVAPPTPAAAAQDGVTPTVTISESSDRLPDLMHSNSASARNRSSAGGVVILPFEHALASLSFLVSKQDESGDSRAEQQLNNVQLKEIRLDNVAETASLNIVTGQWSWAASNVGKRIIYDETMGTPITLTKTAESIGGDILVFPNDDYVDNNAYDASAPYKYYNTANDASASKGEQILVTVKLTGLEQYDALSDDWKPMNKTLTCGAVVENGACEVSFPLRQFSSNGQQDQGPLHFLRNHKYQMNVIVERDNVQVVAVTPQVYEWVDVEPDRDHMGTLGQPVTIGGLVWMDRNIGASSADCENDWWHTCGYYYQYGRNIPYIINLDAILNADGSEKDGVLYSANTQRVFRAIVPYQSRPSDQPISTWTFTRGDFWYHPTDAPDDQGAYLIYTLDQHGNKVYDWESTRKYYYSRPGDPVLPGRTPAALNPGDEGYYGFLAGGGSGCTEVWSWDPEGQPDPRVISYWWEGENANGSTIEGRMTSNGYLLASRVENQPVPKGWRLPRRADGYKILPEPAQDANPWTADNAFLFQGTTRDLGEDILNTAGEYRFQYVRGRITIGNETPGADHLTTAPHDASYMPCIYGIKYQGTNKAYRVRIRMVASSYSERYFLRIEMFPGTENDIFKTDIDPTGRLNGFSEYGEDGFGSVGQTVYYGGADHVVNLAYDGTPIQRWNLQDFDWNHPSGSIDFPLQGYLDAGGTYPFWNQIGNATILRVPEHQYGGEGMTATGEIRGRNWTLYMRDATSGVSVGKESRWALGDCIRLVRDL